MNDDPEPGEDWETGAPYPGLRPFERHEAVLFFGRDRCVDAMVETLQRKRFLAVLGASGSGKSSLVRTGLFEALEAGLAHIPGPRWLFADIRHPGGAPFRELARALFAAVGEPADADRVAALSEALRDSPRKLLEWWNAAERHPDDNLLILVDQFEELFRYRSVGQRDNVEAFVDLLLSAAANDDAPIYVVLTMRSEYLGVCSLISGLAEQINHSLGLTPRMLREECAAAIVGPSRIAGFTVQPELVNTLLNDMNALAPWPEGSDDGREIDQAELIARRADQLPLMQHVLNLLWTKAAADSPDDIVLTLQAYRDLGGLSGALTRHADAVMDATGEPELTEAIFRALTEGVTIAGAVRRHRTIADLIAETGAPEARVRAVVDRFRAADANFLSPALPAPLELGDSVDISHESLIRQWTRLSEWLKKEAEAGKTWRDLQRALDRKSTVGLIGGRLLRSNLDWMAAHRPTEAWARRYDGRYREVQDFLAESEAEDARGRRRSKGRRALTFGAAAMLPLAYYATAGVLAERAEAQAEIRAQEKTRLAEAEAARERGLARAATERAARARELAALDRASADQAIAQANERARVIVASAQRDLQVSRAQAEKMRSGAVLFARSSAELLSQSIDTYVEQAFQPGRPQELVRNNFNRVEETLASLMASSAAAEVRDEADFAAQSARVQLANAELHQGDLRLGDAFEAAGAAGAIAPASSPALRAEALAQQGRIRLMEGRNVEARPLFEEALRLVGWQPGRAADGDMLRAGSLALYGLARLAADEERPDEVTRLADHCLELARQFQAEGRLGEYVAALEAAAAAGAAQAEATSAGAGSPPQPDPEAGGRLVSPERSFEARLLCLTPLMQIAESTEEELGPLLEQRGPDIELAWMMSEQVVPTDLRLLRLWSDFLFVMAEKLPEERSRFGEMLVGLYPNLQSAERWLLRTRSEDSGDRPRGPYEAWYLGDLLNYSRARSMRIEGEDLDDAERREYLNSSARVYNEIWWRLQRRSEPFLVGLADRAVNDFASQLADVGGVGGIPVGANLSAIALEVNALSFALSPGEAFGGDRAPIHPAMAGVALGLIDLLARPETGVELQRYPNFQTGSRLLLTRAQQICVALARTGSDPCTERGLDPSSLDAAVGRTADSLARLQMGTEATGFARLEVAHDGIDPVACVEDIENRRGLANPPDRADTDPPVCTLQRGLGGIALVDEGKVWLFTSPEYRLRFSENRERYSTEGLDAVPAVVPARASMIAAGATQAQQPRPMFGRLIGGRLRLYASYQDAVDDHDHGDDLSMAP